MVRRSSLRFVFEFLGSMNLAISLLVTLAVASIIGTVLQQNQPYPEYVIQFGPFWFDVFRALGFYDIYSAGWFLAILGFLLVSTAVCVVRNGPGMLREWRSWRTRVTYKSLRHGRHRREWVVAAEPGETADALAVGLQRAGYGSRVEQADDHVLIAARRGQWNRLGYIFTHLAIVIICLGGLMDSRMSIKVAELAGLLEPEMRNIRASQIPDISRLPVWNPAFRSSVQITEGRGTNVAFVNLRDGFLVQPLPFTIELEAFRIERYSTGEPKSFESDLIVHDPELDQPLQTTISVNDPLIHRGYAVYQSSFADGGSRLDLKAWPLAAAGEPVEFTGEVRAREAFPPAAGDVRIEFDDFTLFNINRVREGDGETAQRNFGPSFDYRLRDAAGNSREYRTFMLPVERDGGTYFLSGVRDGPDREHQYLYIPADARGGLDRFMTLLERMDDQERVERIARAAVGYSVRDTALDDAAQRENLIGAMARMVGLFRQQGFDAIWQDIEPRVPEERREAVFTAYLRVLHNVMSGLYREVLVDEGVEQPGDDEWAFFEDALTAINALSEYGSGWYLQLQGFEHVQASGLQIARTPGKPVVYFGSLMLVIGLFLMFYVDHRRLWIWLAQDAASRGGATRVLLAGSSVRDTLDFARDFSGLADRLEGGTRRPREND